MAHRASATEIAAAESLFLVHSRAVDLAAQSEAKGLAQFVKAESLYKRQVSTESITSGESSLVVSMLLAALAKTELGIGHDRLPACLSNARRAIRIQERLLEPNDPRRQSALTSASRAAVNLGELDLAIRYSEETVRLLEAQAHPDTLALGRALDALGFAYENARIYSEALLFYDRAVSLLQYPAIRDTLALFGAWNDEALLLYSFKDYAGARATFDVAYATLAQDSVRWAKQLRMIAANRAIGDAEIGPFDRARVQFERRLEQTRVEDGQRSQNYARWLNNLSMFECQHGDPRRSLDLGMQALKIRREIPDWGGVVESLQNLGLTWQVLGVPDSARAYASQALAWASQRMSHGSAQLIPLLLSASQAQLAGGADSAAFESAAHAESLAVEQMGLNLRLLSERQNLEFVLNRESGLDLLLTIAAASGDSSRALVAWDAELRARTLVLDEMAFRQRYLNTSAGSGVEALRESLQVARRGLLEALQASDTSSAIQETRVLQARRSLDEWERRLATVSTLFRRERAHNRVGIREVVAALPSDARLVAFIRFREHRRVPMKVSIAGRELIGARLDTTSAYAAFVLDGSNGSVRMVSLGSARDIDSLVTVWRLAVQSPPRSAGRAGPAEQRVRRSGLELRRRVWDPLTAQLRGADRVFVVPDGALLLVNFAALPAARDSFLAESGPLLHVLSAERDLARVPDAGGTDGELLAMGDPDFSLSHISSSPSRGAPTKSGSCSGPGDASFAPLPESAEEVREIAGLWRSPPVKSGARQRDARVLVRANASKRNFLDAAPHCRDLHLATHAFFLNEACTTYVTHPARAGRPAVRITAVRTDPPLLRSGIVLARSTRGVGSDRYGGVVTAQEIAGLDLSGVDWAVVSGCDAGLGVLRAGEGLFGLRRAFQVAGARTTIVGLWKVDDSAARSWMRELYLARVTGGLPTAEAVRAADRATLRARRAHGLSTHPGFWAPFVATGDWR